MAILSHRIGQNTSTLRQFLNFLFSGEARTSRYQSLLGRNRDAESSVRSLFSYEAIKVFLHSLQCFHVCFPIWYLECVVRVLTIHLFTQISLQRNSIATGRKTLEVYLVISVLQGNHHSKCSESVQNGIIMT